MVGDDGLRVRVLGPLRTEVDGRAVEVPGRSLRRLLVRLVLAGGEVVPDRVLLADVWGADAALPVLHTAVARLRRALEPGRGDRAPGRLVVREGDGYSVRLAPRGVDADRFTADARRGATLLRAGRAADARTALSAARAAWTGSPYADAAEHPFAEAESARLVALRTEVEELLLDAAVRLGDPLAIPSLTAFVTDHPGREHAVELLVRALCAEQRAAEALGVLRRARAATIEATGSELGPALQALQRAVLRNDRALTEPRGRPAAPRRLLPTSNLPAPVSSFVGRDAELQEVARRLAAARLLVLVGPGGAGKTRLALETAAARRDQDGPWFVDLADLQEGGLLAERTALALGLGGTGTVDALAAALRDRTALLLLDNCEQVADEVGTFATALLARCPSLTVLATTREPLGVPGEELLPVAPLSSGVDGDAVRLFLTRAAETSGRQAATERPEDAVELCDELDGLPLAIELAAARSNALSIEDLRRGLADRFALLRRDGRGGRHATMLAAVEWTHRMLDDDEREVYQALAVFRGGFRLDAAEAVAGRPDTATLVARLVSRSIVTVEEGAQRRYRLLETLRAHAERVTPPERRRRLVQRHLDWVRDLASEADAALRGRLSSTATTALQDEASNIRAALDVADAATVLRIGGGFYWFWYREGLTREGLGHLVPAIAATADDDAADLGDRCRAGMGVALLSYLRGDLDAVRSALQRAGQDAERCGDAKVTTQYLSTLAYFEAGSGLVVPGREHALRSLRLARSIADRGAVAESLMVLGEVARRSGRLEEAASSLREAVGEARASGYTWAATSSLWIASKVELQAGRLESARRTAVASATGSQREHETTSWIVGLVTVAHLDLLLGQAERSALIAGAADWLGARIGFQPAAMDADLAAWTAELAARHRRPDLAEAVERGRRLTTEHLLALLEGGGSTSPGDPVAHSEAPGPARVGLP